MLQNFGLAYGMVQRFSQKFPVSFSAVSVTFRIGARGKDCQTGYFSTYSIKFTYLVLVGRKRTQTTVRKE